MLWEKDDYMSKPKMRTRLASLTFTEKTKVRETLLDRSQKIAASGSEKV